MPLVTWREYAIEGCSSFELRVRHLRLQVWLKGPELLFAPDDAPWAWRIASDVPCPLPGDASSWNEGARLPSHHAAQELALTTAISRYCPPDGFLTPEELSALERERALLVLQG